MELSASQKAELCEHYQALVTSVYGGQDWIVATPILVGSARDAHLIRQCGANRVLAIGARRGVGTIEEEEGITLLDLGLETGGMMEMILRAQEVFTDLPIEFRQTINEWDPDQGAKVVGAIFDSNESVGGREVFGGRTKDWMLLEDKLIATSLFAGAGISHAPSRNAPIEACEAASRGLDRGHGTVWAGDNRDGWHGGATRTRWVRTPSEAKEVAQFLSQHCDTARVMPFLDGIPCSIHGIVFPEHTIALRPCEMLVFRTPDPQGFVYASAATLWDPPKADRKVMRAAAKKIGDHLRHRVAFQGPFTLDGVMTAEGFLPTEVNTRAGAGLARIAAGLDDFPLLLLCRAIIERLDLDWRHEELEALLIDSADNQRVVGAHYGTENPPEEATSHCIARSQSGYVLLPEDSENPDGKLSYGPGPTGGHVVVRLNTDRLPVGESAAPYIRDALRLAADTWEFELPPMEPAPDLRR